MRKTIALLAGALLVLSLAGCGQDKDCDQYPTGSADKFACEG